MKTALTLLVLVSLAAVVGCGSDVKPTKPSASSTTTTPSHSTATAPNSSTANTDNAKPDNTAVNQRDRDSDAKTPIDQNENQADINITADIRKQVLAHDNMSTDARNVKIITADRKVTLRGPVDSAEERDIIAKIAEDVAGKDNVDNQIEVTEKK